MLLDLMAHQTVLGHMQSVLLLVVVQGDGPGEDLQPQLLPGPGEPLPGSAGGVASPTPAIGMERGKPLSSSSPSR